jgi:MoaA/NifB/PqqE/SkfB family radical SAM enzyme
MIYSLWDITPCSPLKTVRRFGGTCGHLFRFEELKPAWRKQEAELWTGLGGSHNQSERSCEEKGLCPPAEIEPWFLCHSTRNLATIVNELSRPIM